MAYRIVNHLKLRSKALTHKVRPLFGTQYQVLSGASGNFYVVNLANRNRNGRPSCSCERGNYISEKMNDHANACSHVMAVFIFTEQEDKVYVRPANVPIAHLHRRTIRNAAGDNVIFTARKDVKRVAPQELTSEERLAQVEAINAELGLG